MKTLVTGTISTLAAMAFLSACTQSEGSRSTAAVAPNPETKVETMNTTLVGTYKGVSAVCEDGSEAKKDNDSIKLTTLTLTTDGFFRTETKIKESLLEVEGTYTVSEDRLTLATKSEAFEGQIGFTDTTTESKFKLEGEELTLTILPTEDSSCPPDTALMVKYQRQNLSPSM